MQLYETIYEMKQPCSKVCVGLGGNKLREECCCGTRARMQALGIVPYLVEIPRRTHVQTKNSKFLQESSDFSFR
jgi:hypothetical protein